MSLRRALQLVGCLLVLTLTGLHAQAPQGAPNPMSGAPSNSSPVTLTLADALNRAKANSAQFQAALTQFGLAKEDRLQARAALLPNIQYTNSFIYTQGNGATGR